MLCLTIYLDGQTSDCGYKYIMTRDGASWTACRNDNEFRYFLQNTGLKINPECTQLHDMREQGKGRIITSSFFPRSVEKCLFWNIDEIPQNATHFIGLSNGSYVNCYSFIEDNKTTIYRPNPNAKSVYLSYEGKEIMERLAKGVFLKGYRNSFEATLNYFA